MANNYVRGDRWRKIYSGTSRTFHIQERDLIPRVVFDRNPVREPEK